MEQNFQDIYEQLQSRIRQAEDKRLQLKAKGTKNGLIAGGITLVAGVVVSLIIGGGWPGILIACILGLIVLFSPSRENYVLIIKKISSHPLFPIFARKQVTGRKAESQNRSL